MRAGRARGGDEVGQQLSGERDAAVASRGAGSLGSLGRVSERAGGLTAWGSAIRLAPRAQVTVRNTLYGIRRPELQQNVEKRVLLRKIRP